MRANKMVKNGFTLIELMVVVIIFSIITAILIPNYQSYKRKNDENIAEQALNRISLELEQEKARNFNFSGYKLAKEESTLPKGKTGKDIKYNIFLNSTVQTWTLMACVNDQLSGKDTYKNFAKKNDGRTCEWRGACVLPEACK